ncbi:hypothetical protein BJY04DRAFT_181726 [Aspergillus karnatakaensis]|uniref:carbohydrate-binding module family 48 protein n=1 Tax=Aspergillus karnatakaensis TaxID=1810916 RepID=UPI003CCDE6B5
MGSYTFRWPYNATEVFVTGTFDDWGKTIKLDQKGDVFEKQVHLPLTSEKVHFKFVVDGLWTTDKRFPEEDDGSSNVNNVLYPDQIQADSVAALQNGTEDMATLSGVAPTSTTAGLAGGVPKESSRTAAPGSTTAGLDKDVPLEQRANVPGGFPADTPVSEYSVNPIPASSGIGNPIHLQPGEKVPDPSTFNSNTVQSTARTGQEAYEQPASATLDSPFSLPPVSSSTIPESSLPIGGGANTSTTDPGATIQSAAPTSTTAALAAKVPYETQKKQTDNTNPVDDVPDVVKKSISEAHRPPEAAANEVVVEEKKELEHELQQKIQVDNSVGAPAPTATAATTETAPKPTGAESGSARVSPRTTSPARPADTTETKKPETPKESKKETLSPATNNTTNNATNNKAPAQDTQVPPASPGGKEEKKKKRSSFFGKLKEKFK